MMFLDIHIFVDLFYGVLYVIVLYKICFSGTQEDDVSGYTQFVDLFYVVLYVIVLHKICFSGTQVDDVSGFTRMCRLVLCSFVCDCPS